MAKPLSARNSMADVRPALADPPHEPFEDGHHAMTGMDRPGPEDRRDQLVGLAIEDEEWVIHVLAEVAVIALPFLLPMHRVVRPIQIEQDAARLGRLAPAP